jgi:hypothetical protein
MTFMTIGFVLGVGRCRTGSGPAPLPANPHDILLKPHLVKTFKISRVYWTMDTKPNELCSKIPFIYDLFIEGVAKRKEKNRL